MSKEKVAVYAGTFDPITLGHLDVIERAAKIFDKMIVAITTNPSKEPLFSLEERVFLAEKTTSSISNVSVQPFTGLLVDFLKKKNCRVILRGLRELSDFESEFQQAIVNRKLFPQVDTVFIMTAARYLYVSSSMVKEIASLHGSLEKFVPKAVEKALRKKFQGKEK